MFQAHMRLLGHPDDRAPVLGATDNVRGERSDVEHAPAGRAATERGLRSDSGVASAELDEVDQVLMTGQRVDLVQRVERVQLGECGRRPDL